MKITDLLVPERISLNRKLTGKTAAIDALISLHEKSGSLSDSAVYKKAILAREAQGSTAIGDGIAIPHAKSPAVKKPALAALTCPAGVDYEALDGKPSRLLFMIASPEDGDLHLEVLAKLMTLLMDGTFRESLLAAASPAEFISVIDKAEKISEKAKSEASSKSLSYRVLAVTACPTGIAHTYMAAEALEKAGERLGYPLKAETNGSGGAKNVLTAAEIEAADGIIIAADKSVDMARFNGKRLISVKVSDGIKKPDELIERIMSGDAPIYTHKGEMPSASQDGESIGRQIYKHLMNGVSHMLPFVVAGGIFIAIAFLIDSIAGAPQDANFGTNTPAAAFFKTVGGYAFNFMIPILAAFIAGSIADRPGLLVGFVGGYLATLGSTFAAVAGDIPSGFLGALFAGFAGGYLMLGLRRLLDLLPDALEGIKPVLLYPILGLALIAILMCTVNPFMGMINTS
ncbi:MAG: PTS sugar transporter subunit IIA, partial [Clostridia bacterium]|nr:PTS sugar transporter subunit IIA [Clostridia bacterium]